MLSPNTDLLAVTALKSAAEGRGRIAGRLREQVESAKAKAEAGTGREEL